MSESTESRFEKWIKESDWAEELWVDGRESALHQRIMAAVAKTPQQKPDEPTQRGRSWRPSPQDRPAR